MKTITVLVPLLACALGCSKEKPKTTPTPPPAQSATKKEEAKPAPDVKEDQPVSPSLAVSADIAAACGIQATPNPKFDYDQDDLTEADRAVLATLATCLTTGALKGKSVLMIGRADPRGTQEYNLGLGSRRAASVSQYLVRLGVGPSQLEVTTRGAIDATGTDEATWRQDRRVDVQLAEP